MHGDPVPDAMAPSLRRVRLYARDLGKMRDFYTRVLGFRELAAAVETVRLDAGGVEIVLQRDPPFGQQEFQDFINQLKGNMRGMGSALHFEVDDVETRFAQVRERGAIPIEPERNRTLDAPVEREGRRGFAIEDPEGYWVFFESTMHEEDAPARTLLFVCEGNRARSQMAEGFFNAWAPPGWRGISAGTKPKESVHPLAEELMREAGIDISRQKPKVLDMEVARAAWRVLAMCTIDSCPVEVAEKMDRWDVPDPADVPESRWREIRETIAGRVKALVREIELVQGLTP